MRERISLSHNDLDGVGSSLVLQNHFGEMDTYHVSYEDIKETLQGIESNITHLTRTLFVTDLSFDVEAFNELMRVADNHKHLKIVYIDHHPMEGEVLDAFEELKTFPNVFVKHEIGKSATMLTFEFLSNRENKNLEKLVKWIDAFDIYKEYEDPENFKIGWFLNTIFWQIKIPSFKFNLQKENFKIPKFFKELYKETVIGKNAYFEKQIKNDLVIFDDTCGILLAFSDKYKSFWQMDYPEYDYFVLPYHTIGNNISIRFSTRVAKVDANWFKKEVIKFVSKSPWCISSGGHDHAFGITLDKNMPKEDHLNLIEGIIDVISLEHKQIIPF